jgi:hypothetical protein
LAQCHGSDLLTLRLRFAHKPALLFEASPDVWMGLPGFATPGVHPGHRARFISPFGAFRVADARCAAKNAWPCWSTVATTCPLGNCDSPKLETSLGYLTRLGTVSHRSSPRGSLIAISRPRANAAGGTGELCLRTTPAGGSSSGAKPTSLA